MIVVFFAQNRENETLKFFNQSITAISELRTVSEAAINRDGKSLDELAKGLVELCTVRSDHARAANPATGAPGRNQRVPRAGSLSFGVR